MPGIYYGPYGAQYETYVEPDGSNCGRYPLGHHLVLPDGRVHCHAKNDGTAEVAGNLYQSALPIANHHNIACDTARAIGAVVISATTGATAGAADLYSEGLVLTNDATGEGYEYAIKRAYAPNDAHAAIAGSDVVIMNLAPGESVQIALVVTTSEVSFNHNRFQNVLIHASPPTAGLAGVASAAAAANRYYWSQVSGPCAVLTQGTLVIGDFCAPSATVDGAVMPSAAFETDGPYVGIVRRVSADTEYSLVDLKIG